MKQLFRAVLSAALAVLGCAAPAGADLRVGEEARLFKSVDENLRHVDMGELIEGRPLVLVVGSCS